MFKKAKGENVEQRIARVLSVYRNLQHLTTDHTPAELFLGCQPRTWLSLAKPDLRSRVEGKQQQAKNYHDRNPQTRSFNVGQRVKVKNFRGKEKWLSGTVAEVTGFSTYRVNLPNGPRLVHIDQMIHDGSEIVPTLDAEDWEPSDSMLSENGFRPTAVDLSDEQLPEQEISGPSPNPPAPMTSNSPEALQPGIVSGSPSATVTNPNTPKSLPSLPRLSSRPRRNCGPPKKLDL